MTPEEILRPFLSKYDLPSELVELLYLLIQREIETNFASLNYRPDLTRKDPALSLAEGLDYIFRRLPKLYSKDEGKLTATIGELAHFTNDDVAYLHSLRTNTEAYAYLSQRATLRNEINDLQHQIDTKERGEDVGWQRSSLRSLKEELKELKEPEVTPRLTHFWIDLLYFNVSFEIPQEIRWAHTLILGSSGSGKTQLQHLLAYQDINTPASVVVIEPKGKLVQNLYTRADPERVILIHPDNPPALNPFQMGGDPNTIVSLLNYALASTAATEKQTELLEYCVRLVVATPDTTLASLRDLVRSTTLPEMYLKHVKKLSPDAQDFFAHDFHTKGTGGYGETKDQIRWRIRTLLKNPIIEQMFCSKADPLDIPRALDEGKIILVNTTPSKLGDEGCAFLGRFIVAVIANASARRETGSNPHPTLVYLDEAGLYVDKKMELMLQRARESRIGFTISLTELSQASPTLQAALLSNTSTKIVGGCSEHDARVLSSPLRIPADHIEHQQAMNFKLKVKGFLDVAVPIRIKAGYIESLPKRSVVHRVQAVQNVHKEKIYTPDVGTDTSTEW